MRKLLLLLLPASLLGAGYSFYAATERTVYVNGRLVVTHARTVGGALREAGIAVVPNDLVEPALETPLAESLPITYRGAPPVFLRVADQKTALHTWQTTPAEIIASAGIEVARGDSLWVNGLRGPAADQVYSNPPHSLLVRKPVEVTVENGEDRLTLTTTALTVGGALWEAGLAVRLGDGVAPSLDSPLTPGMTIQLSPSRPLIVSLDGQEIRSRTFRTTVGEALDDLGVVLVGEDYTVPGLFDPIPPDGSIAVVRVTEQIAIEHSPISFETLWQAAPQIELDQRALVQAGVPGVKASRYRVRLENGQENGRTLDSEWTALEPVPQIIGYGTNIVVRVVETPDGPLEYWRSATFYATSYSPSRSGTSASAPWYGRTRTGKTLTVGMAAVDTHLMPLGTRMYVPGYGFVTAEDTGSGVRGKLIDLGYDDLSYQSWRQYVTVYFLTPLPPPEQIIWLWPQ